MVVMRKAAKKCDDQATKVKFIKYFAPVNLRILGAKYSLQLKTYYEILILYLL